jgi:hypothetical protein
MSDNTHDALRRQLVDAEQQWALTQAARDEANAALVTALARAERYRNRALALVRTSKHWRARWRVEQAGDLAIVTAVIMAHEQKQRARAAERDAAQLRAAWDEYLGQLRVRRDAQVDDTAKYVLAGEYNYGCDVYHLALAAAQPPGAAGG